MLNSLAYHFSALLRLAYVKLIEGLSFFLLDNQRNKEKTAEKDAGQGGQLRSEFPSWTKFDQALLSHEESASAQELTTGFSLLCLRLMY